VIYGFGGDDTILGKGKHDELYGGPGKDSISGDDGDDDAYGDSGNDQVRRGNNDTINSRDGGPHIVSCGLGGDDRVNADPEDDVADDCEDK
jgi:Ca2+-binding RTX toxin-like protein